MNNFFCILFILGLSTLCFGQLRPNDKCERLLNKSKPSAYISFERYGLRSDVREGEQKERIFLRIHNNSNSTIYLTTDGAEDPEADHRVSYEVRWIAGMENRQSERPLPIGTRLSHKKRVQEISGGETFVFSIPRDHLSDGWAIFVSFSYEWELLGKTGGDLSISHELPFWSSNLPSR